MNSFKCKENIKLSDIANTNSYFTDKYVTGVNTILDASDTEIISFHNRKYSKQLLTTKALACFIKEEDKHLLPNHVFPIISKNPYFDFANLINNIYEDIFKDTVYENGISKDSKIGKNVEIGINVVIGPGVVIGDNTKIMHNSVIMHADIGDNCIIKSGAVIGGFGFGFDMQNKIYIPHIGRVIIGNDVLIGSGTIIDRGSVSNTEIGDFSKIDNLIQIAHNVRIGKRVVIASQTGIAGSTTIGENTTIGGQSGINGHINIGKNVVIAAKSGVVSDIIDGTFVGGAPAVPMDQLKRQLYAIYKMSKK